MPHAPPRKRSSSSRAGRAEIISSSPYKKTLSESLAVKKDRQKTPTRSKRRSTPAVNNKPSTNEDQAVRKQGHQGKRKAATSTSGKGQKKKRPEPSRAEAESDDELCLYCNEHYSESGWTQCQVCLKWAHDICGGVSTSQLHFVCELCASSSQ